MNEALMQIVVDAITFLALSDDALVDQDAATEQLEHMGAELRRLGTEEGARFLAFVAERARSAERTGDVDRAEFLRALPDQLGLTSDSELGT